MAGFVAKLLHDVLIFRIDHRFRNVEVCAATASWSSRRRFMWVRVRPLSSWLLLVADAARVSCSRSLQAERLGEIVVELALAGDLHRLDGDRERRRPCPSDSRPDNRPGRSPSPRARRRPSRRPAGPRSRGSAGPNRARPACRCRCRRRTACRRRLPAKSITTRSPVAAAWPFLARRSSSCSSRRAA